MPGDVPACGKEAPECRADGEMRPPTTRRPAAPGLNHGTMSSRQKRRLAAMWNANCPALPPRFRPVSRAGGKTLRSSQRLRLEPLGDACDFVDPALLERSLRDPPSLRRFR